MAAASAGRRHAGGAAIMATATYTAMLFAEWPLGKLELCVMTGWRSKSGRGRPTTSFRPSTVSRSMITVAARRSAGRRLLSNGEPGGGR